MKAYYLYDQYILIPAYKLFNIQKKDIDYRVAKRHVPAYKVLGFNKEDIANNTITKVMLEKKKAEFENMIKNKKIQILFKHKAREIFEDAYNDIYKTLDFVKEGENKKSS